MNKLLVKRIATLIAFVLILAGFVWLLVIFYNKPSKDELAKLESLFKITGIFAAAVFFVYKLFTGWLILNLNVRLETERLAAENDIEDHLVIQVILVKGQTDSVWLRDVAIRVSDLNAPAIEGAAPNIIRPVGMDRLNPDISAWAKEGKDRLLNISPGEEARFTAYTVVPRGTVVVLEAVVMGTRPFYNFESSSDDPIQWKSSAVVLPVVKAV